MERAHEREYDLLRVICCAAVVVLHTGSIYLAGWQPGMPAANRTAAALMQSLTRDAVPLFVMLSGAFSCRTRKAVTSGSSTGSPGRKWEFLRWYSAHCT